MEVLIDDKLKPVSGSSRLESHIACPEQVRSYLHVVGDYTRYKVHIFLVSGP